jgi:NADH dehydrogenase FAD-containing subunit
VTDGKKRLRGPDLTRGVAVAKIADGTIQMGHAKGEPVLITRSGSELFAVGDIARWPDRLTGEKIRVEHCVVAERQGQAAARNMLGKRERFDAVPFFWTEHDFQLTYADHADKFDCAEIEGSIDARDCTIT